MATYATTKEALEQYIQKEWKQGGYDVARSLRDLKEIDIEANKPKREISTKADA